MKLVMQIMIVSFLIPKLAKMVDTNSVMQSNKTNGIYEWIDKYSQKYVKGGKQHTWHKSDRSVITTTYYPAQSYITVQLGEKGESDLMEWVA